MDNDNFQPIEDLLVEAQNRAKVVLDGYSVRQAGYQSAYFTYSYVCKALANLRALKAMNV